MLSNVPLPNFLDTAIIGAGPQALTLAAHLLQKRQKFRRKFLVFDPSGTWLSRWREQFAAQEIPHLRSPAVHHPDPNPFALRKFAEKHPQPFFPPYDLPETQLFDDFCREVIHRWQLENKVYPAKVARVIPCNTGRKSQFRLFLESGESLIARRVVFATGGGKPQLPEWVKQISSPYPEDRLCHSQQVNLAKLSLFAEKILIVGGGLTSGHLAIGAIKRGATVTLMARRTWQEKLFDAEPGWLGPKYLKGFFAESDWQKRWQMIQEARNGGSFTPAVMLQLRRLAREKKVSLLKNCEVMQAVWQGKTWQVTCANGEQHTYDRIWLATGTQMNVTQHPLLPEILNSYPVDIVKGLPVLDEHLRIPGSEAFVMGGLAGLQIGPVARNIAGGRMACDRIVPALTKASVR